MSVILVLAKNPWQNGWSMWFHFKRSILDTLGLVILYIALLRKECSIKAHLTNSVPTQGFWRCTVYITDCRVQKLGTADRCSPSHFLSTYMSHSSPKNCVPQLCTKVLALFWAWVNCCVFYEHRSIGSKFCVWKGRVWRQTDFYKASNSSLLPDGVMTAQFLKKM